MVQRSHLLCLSSRCRTLLQVPGTSCSQQGGQHMHLSAKWVLHCFIFILLEAYLELLPWILQNPLGMLWAQLSWLDTLMAKSTEYTGTEQQSHSWSQGLWQCRALWQRVVTNTGLQQCSSREIQVRPQQMHFQHWHSPVPAPGLKLPPAHSLGSQMLLSGACIRVVLTSASPTKCFNNIFQKTDIVYKHLLTWLWVCSSGMLLRKKPPIIVFHVILHCNNWSSAAKIGLLFPHILLLYDLT